MVLDEISDFGNLTVTEDASVLKHCIAVAFYEELGRPALGEFFVASVHMHTLDHTERGEIQVITGYLKIVILRHV